MMEKSNYPPESLPFTEQSSDSGNNKDGGHQIITAARPPIIDEAIRLFGRNMRMLELKNTDLLNDKKDQEIAALKRQREKDMEALRRERDMEAARRERDMEASRRERDMEALRRERDMEALKLESENKLLIQKTLFLEREKMESEYERFSKLFNR